MTVVDNLHSMSLQNHTELKRSFTRSVSEINKETHGPAS